MVCEDASHCLSPPAALSVPATQSVSATRCKLLALRLALATHDVAVWIDSDAWFATDAAEGRIEAAIAGIQRSAECAWFANDAPWGSHEGGPSSRPNTGLMVWRRGRECLRLLRAWWMIDVAARTNYYEQTALSQLFKGTGRTDPSAVGALHCKRVQNRGIWQHTGRTKVPYAPWTGSDARLLRVLPELSIMDDRLDAQPRPVVHMPHYYDSGRWQQMCSAAIASGVGLLPQRQEILINLTDTAQLFEE
jgi:hypothetical protein